MSKASAEAQKYAVDIKNGTGSAQVYANTQRQLQTSLKETSTASRVASTGIKILSTTLNTVAFTAIFTLISKWISWATQKIDDYIHRNEIAIEKAEELLNNFKADIDTITSNQNKLDGYINEFERLSKGVDNLGRNVSLTADEYIRYQSIVREIVGINPSLIAGYDEENNILANKNGLLETSIQLLKDEYNQKLKNLALPENINTAINGTIGRYNESKKDFLEVEIPISLAYSGVKIDENGNRQTGYVNQISQYIEDVIGVEFTGWEGGINQYILNNAEAIFDNLDKIKERAAQTKDGWEGLNDSQLIDLMDYFKELRIAYNDMNRASTSANTTLQYVAMAEESYSELSDIQKKFIADYINGIRVTSDTTDKEKDAIRKSIISITQELASLDDIEIENALADLYAIPTDEQSIEEFISQFRDALEIIQEYCDKNGIEIPLSISDNEQSINELEALYQRVVDFSRDKFIGYDPTDFFRTNSINTQQEINKWLEIAQTVNSAVDAEEEYIRYLRSNSEIIDSLSVWQSSLYSPDQTYSDLIKDWESQTKQLQSVLSDIRSGDTAMTAADIVSQFPDLQPYIDQYDDLALAVDTFMRDSYEELLDKFGDTSNIEGFSYELEYLQGVLNEGLGGANNIDHLVAAYEELIGILEQVNSDHTFTEEEIANLINKYDALKDAIIITTDGYKLEDDALIDLINNYVSLSNTAISNQIELTQTTIEGIEARVKAWGMEIEALKTIAKIYNATGGSEDAVGQYIYDNYGTNLTSATPAIIAAATEYTAASNQLDGLLEQLNNSYAAGSKYKSGGSSSSAVESFTDTLEKELAALDKSMEAGYIEFNDYITARLGLIEDYYRKGRIAADEYYSYLEKHYDQQLSAMDRVVNAVTRRIDAEIDGLEKQKSSIESIYNAQIESLEKQKTLLQEANKERERQADLQKALYELERAQQQKTKMVFTENGGMRYVTDDAAIKEASQNVDDARLEIQISELDRSISKLEEARDRETAAFDERISKLKEYKDSWSDLTSAYEEEQDNLLAAQILGQEWEEDILNGRLDTLDAFKNQYISIQQAMADAAWQSANEQIKAAQEAQKGTSGTASGGTVIPDTVSTSGPHTSPGNKSNIKYVAFHEYASGTDNAKKGINLVGEDGTEAYFDNHGHIALITEPTLIPMEGGEVVKNESATRKLLNPNNLAAVDTSTLAGIDNSDPIASGRLRPIQSGDRAWELQQSLIAYLAKMGSDINALVAPVNAIQRDTEQIAGTNINTNQIHNANQMQQVTIGDIHVTCPGVTSQEIMNQVGEALNRQLGGIALDALQESTKR